MNRAFRYVFLLAGVWILAPGCSDVSSPRGFQTLAEGEGGAVHFLAGATSPFERCHASTVVQAASGTLYCAWFGGSGEGNDDVGIWLSEFENGRWSIPVEIAKVREVAHWNPVLFRDGEDRLHLFFKVGIDTNTWQTYWLHLGANGQWTTPEELVPGDRGGRGPVKNKPIVLHDGTWLAPASTETPVLFGETWRPFADRSADGGATWIRSADFAIDEELPGRGAIQPTFWTSGEDGAHALMRSQGGRIWRADSQDGGKTWSGVYETELPNNNSGIDLLQLEDGRLILAYNLSAAPFGFRNVLALAVSHDNGETWQSFARLAYDANPFAEFSYPSIARTESGLAVSHTWNRTDIRCWQIPLSALPD